MLISPHSLHHKHFVEVLCSLTPSSTAIKGKGALQRELLLGICFQHQPLSRSSRCTAAPPALVWPREGNFVSSSEALPRNCVVAALPCVPGVLWAALAAGTAMALSLDPEGLVEVVL